MNNLTSIVVIFGAGITERDMDLLFLEEFVASKEFTNLFMSKIGVKDYEVIRVEHSIHQSGEGVVVKEAGAETSRGESDMTVVYNSNGMTCALLIEDKINACAQPNQRTRYENRGNEAVSNGEYESFDVFMVAPEQYLGSPLAAEYEHTVSYEEILQYFKQQDSDRSVFKIAILDKAINKGKASYVIQVPSDVVMDFYDSYIDYISTYCNGLQVETSKGAQHGSKSSWIVYATKNPDIKIKHKTRNCIDLIFKVGSENDAKENLKTLLSRLASSVTSHSVSVVEFEREVCIRIPVPALDRSKSVYEQLPLMQKCIEAIQTMYRIVGQYSVCTELTR